MGRLEDTHLVTEYDDDRVKELDLFQTVAEMRRQRVKMVQKEEQYVYSVKCVRDYAAAKESEYSTFIVKQKADQSQTTKV